MNLEDGKCYKTADGKTFMIWVDTVNGALYGFWHEQMLGEPNHGAIEFNQNGQAIYEDYLTKTIHVLGAEFDLVRECTAEELVQIEKEIEELNT
jgi:hypothetical protein